MQAVQQKDDKKKSTAQYINRVKKCKKKKIDKGILELFQEEKSKIILFSGIFPFKKVFLRYKIKKY